MILLGALCAVLVAALVWQAALHGRVVAGLVRSHVADRDHLVACLVARTPGEYAGLVKAVDRPVNPVARRPVDSEAPKVDPDSLKPAGL